MAMALDIGQVPLADPSLPQVFSVGSSTTTPTWTTLPAVSVHTPPVSSHRPTDDLPIGRIIESFTFDSFEDGEEPPVVFLDEQEHIVEDIQPMPWWKPFCSPSPLWSLLRRPFTSISSLFSQAQHDKCRHGHSLDEPDLGSATWDLAEQARRTIPQYVLDHAPLIHLFSGEKYWPGDIEEHLKHVTPFQKDGALRGAKLHYNTTNLNELNDFNEMIYMTSEDNVETYPDWLLGEANIPEVVPGKGHGDQDPNHPIGGRSDAPVITIVVDKGNGTLDAFYFFFYSYNLGNKVLNIRWGNHVGDWEHTVVRFRHGKPEQVWYSEHMHGQAFTYDAVEKIGKRPIGFSATGTHAMYATAGIHAYVLPWGLLHDETDRGPLWDPIQNMHAYTFDVKNRILRASTLTPDSPVDWFYFTGRWGDKAYPLSDPRQYYFAGQYHYVDGPTGPIRKELQREMICTGGFCDVKDSLEDANRVRYWPGGEELSDEEVRMLLEELGNDESLFL